MAHQQMYGGPGALPFATQQADGALQQQLQNSFNQVLQLTSIHNAALPAPGTGVLAHQPTSSGSASSPSRSALSSPQQHGALLVQQRAANKRSQSPESREGEAAGQVASEDVASPTVTPRAKKAKTPAQPGVSRQIKIPQKPNKFRGVTKHRHTQRYEAHLWDSSAPRGGSGSGRKFGKQIYLGGFASEEDAARAYDRAALVWWGDSAQLNFLLSDYLHELPLLETLSRDEVVALLRRGSSGFSRGQSRFRGVTAHHQQTKWEARIGRCNGDNYMYLGVFSTEVEAAMAYDLACLRHRKTQRVITNFPARLYYDDSGRLKDMHELNPQIFHNLSAIETAPGAVAGPATSGDAASDGTDAGPSAPLPPAPSVHFVPGTVPGSNLGLGGPLGAHPVLDLSRPGMPRVPSSEQVLQYQTDERVADSVLLSALPQRISVRPSASEVILPTAMSFPTIILPQLSQLPPAPSIPAAPQPPVATHGAMLAHPSPAAAAVSMPPMPLSAAHPVNPAPRAAAGAAGLLTPPRRRTSSLGMAPMMTCEPDDNWDDLYSLLSEGNVASQVLLNSGGVDLMGLMVSPLRRRSRSLSLPGAQTTGAAQAAGVAGKAAQCAVTDVANQVFITFPPEWLYADIL